jgi:hypothetical protein
LTVRESFNHSHSPHPLQLPVRWCCCKQAARPHGNRRWRPQYKSRLAIFRDSLAAVARVVHFKFSSGLLGFLRTSFPSSFSWPGVRLPAPP